jgi:hypothetical protein
MIKSEPQIEEGNGLIELLQDKDFPVRYSNWLSIIQCLTNYLNQVKENLFSILKKHALSKRIISSII